AEAADDGRAELHVARLPDEEARQRSEADGIGAERALSRRAGFAANDAHRRHLLQLEERRQRETEQQHEADEKALQRRPRRRRRQLGADQAGERAADAELRDIADRRAERTGEEREQS